MKMKKHLLALGVAAGLTSTSWAITPGDQTDATAHVGYYVAKKALKANDGPVQAGAQAGGAVLGAAAAVWAGAKLGGKIGGLVGGLPGVFVGAMIGAV